MPDNIKPKACIHIFNDSIKKNSQQFIPVLQNCLGDLMVMVELLKKRLYFYLETLLH